MKLKKKKNSKQIEIKRMRNSIKIRRERRTILILIRLACVPKERERKGCGRKKYNHRKIPYTHHSCGCASTCIVGRDGRCLFFTIKRHHVCHPKGVNTNGGATVGQKGAIAPLIFLKKNINRLVGLNYCYNLQVRKVVINNNYCYS